MNSPLFTSQRQTLRRQALGGSIRCRANHGPKSADFVSLLNSENPVLQCRSRCRSRRGWWSLCSKVSRPAPTATKICDAEGHVRICMDTTGDDMLPPATVSTLKPQQGNELESDGGVYLRHSRAYLKAFRDQFKDNSRNAYRS